MAAVGVAGEADDDAAGVVAPAGGEQAGEGGDEVDTAVVLNGFGELVAGGGVGDHLQVVAQPLD